ncbi:MAG: hypothetical protein HYT11_02030 [Candidatus Levybacteria bacterium]|nr:hypothetical protein [Candidatus Levybacteria bacterium]
MVESELATLKPGESERAVRTIVPYRAEAVFALAARRQGPEGGQRDWDPTWGHWTPETPEQIENAGKLTQRVQGLLQDDMLGKRMSYTIMEMAGGMLECGEISEEQYLAINDVYYRVTMGDEFKPFEIPEYIVQQYGSIHNK